MMKINFYFVLMLANFFSVQCESAEDEPFITNQGYFYKAYQNSSFCQPYTNITFYPKDQNGVLDLVMKAIAHNLTVKAFGSKHSMTDIICTNGIPICMKNLKNKEMDENNEIVRVEAGNTLEELGEFLDKHNRALLHIPTYTGITIGGAIGTGAHGSSLKHSSSISDFVVGVKIIDGLGQVKKITDSEQLRAFMVHLGLLGIILEVELTTVPQFKVNKTHFKEPDSILDQIDENGEPTIINMARKHDWFEMWWFPSFQQVIIGSGDYVSVDVEGDAHTNFIPRYEPYMAELIGNASELVQRSRSYQLADAVEYLIKKSLVQEVIGRPHVYVENGKFAGWPAIGLSYKMMASNCAGECLWDKPGNVYDFDNSFSMDLKDFSAIIQNLRECQQKFVGDYILQGIYIRFGLKQKALMSKGFDRDMVHIEWVSIKRKNPYQHARLGLATFQTMSHSLDKNFDGRAHWGKNGPYFHRQENIFTCYCKHYKEFTSAMTKYDPNGIFHNKFARRVLRLSNERDTDPNIYGEGNLHCALLDACACNTDEDGKCPEEPEPVSACFSDEDCAVEPITQMCKIVQLDNQSLKRTSFKVCRDIDQLVFEPIRDEYYLLNNLTALLINVIEELSEPIASTTSASASSSTIISVPSTLVPTPFWK